MIQRAMIILTLVLTAAAGAAAEEATREAKGLLKPYLDGAGALAEGRIDDARRAYAAGLERYPDSPHLHLAAARAAAAAGDTAACLTALARLDALGAIIDLAASDTFEPWRDHPGFAALAAALHPDAHPTAEPAAVHELEDAQLWNEGIACDLATGDLYAGSVKRGKIVRLRGGVQEDFGTTAADGLLEVLGLDVDEERRRLWAATGRDEAAPGAKHDFGEAPRANAIVVYDLETGRQVEKHEMVPDGRIHLWNDVTVAGDGTAYFTDMTVGEVWRIPPGGGPEPFLTLDDHNSPNGIVCGEGGLLYIACLEEVLVADTATGAVAPLGRGPDTCTGLGDGLAYGDGHLFITQNNGLLGWRVLQCRLDDSGRAVAATHRLRWTQPAGRMPYTCALGEDVLYVNATADFGWYDDAEDPPPSAIVELAIGR